MLQQPVPTLEQLVERLPTVRDIPSLTENQAKESLLESRKLLDATVEAVKQLHHWSLRLNFEVTAVVEQSRLNNNIHNKQVNELMEMLAKICDLNWEPFRAIFNRAAEDFDAIEKIAWKINFSFKKISNAKRIAKLTMQVKNTLKKLDQQANKFNSLSQHIYDTSLSYFTALQTLKALSGPPPNGTSSATKETTPLIFSSSLRNAGVVPLVPADMAKAPAVVPAPQLLQILPAQQPLVVEHPNNVYKVMDNWWAVPVGALQLCLFLVPPHFNKIFYFYIICNGLAMGMQGSLKHCENPWIWWDVFQFKGTVWPGPTKLSLVLGTECSHRGAMPVTATSLWLQSGWLAALLWIALQMSTSPTPFAFLQVPELIFLSAGGPFLGLG